MASGEEGQVGGSHTGATSGAVGGMDHYPLKRTAAMLNEQLGLYLSEEQQRGLAIGLMAGAVLGSAIITASLVAWIRER